MSLEEQANVDPDTHREEGRVMTEAEPGKMGPQAKALLAQPEEAGKLSPLPRAFTQAA